MECLGNGRHAKPMRGEKLFLSGLTSAVGVVHAGEAAGLAGQHRRDGRVAGRDIQVHQAVVQLA